MLCSLCCRAGSSDKLRLMNVLMDDLRPVKELGIKACKECRFSNGGAYFAAASGSLIQVYNTYTCETIATLRYVSVWGLQLSGCFLLTPL